MTESHIQLNDYWFSIIIETQMIFREKDSSALSELKFKDGLL